MVILKKGLYGTIQAAKLWYSKLLSTLEKLGHTLNPNDTCVFNKMDDNGKQITLGVHVHDLLYTTFSKNVIDKEVAELEEEFPGLIVHRGRKT